MIAADDLYRRFKILRNGDLAGNFKQPSTVRPTASRQLRRGIESRQVGLSGR